MWNPTNWLQPRATPNIFKFAGPIGGNAPDRIGPVFFVWECRIPLKCAIGNPSEEKGFFQKGRCVVFWLVKKPLNPKLFQKENLGGRERERMGD